MYQEVRVAIYNQACGCDADGWYLVHVHTARVPVHRVGVECAAMQATRVVLCKVVDLQGLPQNDALDVIENLGDVVRVRSLGEVCVHTFLARSTGDRSFVCIQRLNELLHIIKTLGVLCERRKVFVDVRLARLDLKGLVRYNKQPCRSNHSATSGIV